jgi:cytochrome c-type biogenesis protein CcmH
MIALILTGIAGVAIGVVIMRLLNGTPPTPNAENLESSNAESSISRVLGSDNAEEISPAALTQSRSWLSRFDRTQLLLGSAGVIIAIAVAMVALRAGAPDTAVVSAPSSTPNAAQVGELDDVGTMISKLAERLKTDTTDGEGFRMLGWSYVNTGRPAEAVGAYSTAVKLLPGRADVHAGFGEAMVAVAKDTVTIDAKTQFDEAIKIDPKEPRARFFLALHKAQNGKENEALAEWIALSNESSAELPWQSDLQQRAAKLAAKIGTNIDGKFKQKATAPAVTSVPKTAGPFISTGPDAATLAAADKMPEADRQSMIDGMVEGLATKLKSNPDDIDGWVKLIRSRVVLKDNAKAKDDLNLARKAFASKPDKLAQLNSLAAELGL